MQDDQAAGLVNCLPIAPAIVVGWRAASQAQEQERCCLAWETDQDSMAIVLASFPVADRLKNVVAT